MQAISCRWWRSASKIPWDEVDLQTWHAQPSCEPPAYSQAVDSTAFLKQFGWAYEHSLREHCTAASSNGLPSACFGRASVLAPSVRLQHPPTLRPSRRGEEVPASGFVGRQVVQWFTQLRRLQALVHNLQAASSAPAALEYRLLTWRAILRARGFGGGFSVWWLVRPKRLQGVVWALPSHLPSLQTLLGIYEDFRVNYRAFEAWNQRSRATVVKATLQESLGKAFHSVLGRPSKPIDHFEQRHVASIVSVDPVDFSVWLDSDLPADARCVWTLDGVPATVHRLASKHFKVVSDLLLCPGQSLEVSVFLTDTTEMLQAVGEFWSARWQRHADIPPEHWTRIMQFVSSYLSPLPFLDSSLSLPLWDNTVQRFHARSARGPDAFDHLDLKRMPSCFKTSLLGMLQKVEQGDEWPCQLLEGFGLCLPKSQTASTIGEHRPVIVFSTIYRAWASLRSRLLLTTLSHHAGPRMRGFLSHCEAGDLWFLVQALAESCLADGTSLCGCFSDLVKAFETIPRRTALALALGIPSTIVDAWMRFLGGCVRRFTLHGAIGDGLSSLVGMPEGCAMSVLGMSLLDFCWDRYQLVYCPKVACFSYVDNLCLVAHSVSQLLAAQASMHTFFQLWGMDLDTRKTYSWATTVSDRAALRRLGCAVRLTSSELGGSLSFCLRSAASLPVQRIDSLGDAWRSLRRSATSAHIKELILRQAFWPKALHGICITPLPWRFVQQLRSRAVKALGHGLAGANPGIRLSLLSRAPDTDPAVFQLLRTFLEFRRLIAKQPTLISLWRDFVMREALCSSLSGPFSKLAEQSVLIRWHFADPPWFLDHDGRFHLLDMPEVLLRDLLLDAWYQSLAVSVSHRKDFDGLCGLQWPPEISENGLSLVDQARLNSLREGAFLTGESQGKFDLLKGPHCRFCGFLDSLAHRCCSCPHYASVRSQHPEALRLWSGSSVSLRERLLPSRNPHAAMVKHSLLALDSGEARFMLEPDGSPHYDLFTDGSAFHPLRVGYGLASFAVVSVQHGQVLVAGPLQGLQQDSNRAELVALKAAASWCILHEVSGTLWTDSAYAGQGFYMLLQGGHWTDFDTNEDLWRELSELLSHSFPHQLQIQHVPGHGGKQPPLDLEAWTAHWNEVADGAARTAHSMRPQDFQHLWHSYVSWSQQQGRQLQCFRDLHLAMAQLPGANLSGDGDFDQEDEAGPLNRHPILDVTSFVDNLPLDWLVRWTGSFGSQHYGVDLVRELVDLLVQDADTLGPAYEISWLELAALVFGQNLSHPLPCTEGSGKTWQDRSRVPVAGWISISVAHRVRYLMSLIRCLDRSFQLGVEFCSGLDRSAWRITFPLSGLVVHLSAASLACIDQVLACFTSQRFVRTSNDLSRPFVRA